MVVARDIQHKPSLSPIVQRKPALTRASVVSVHTTPFSPVGHDAAKRCVRSILSGFSIPRCSPHVHTGFGLSLTKVVVASFGGMRSKGSGSGFVSLLLRCRMKRLELDRGSESGGGVVMF